MNLKEAKQFVALFVTGGYTPEEYAAFLRWLKGATVEELNIIADEHEARYEGWPLQSGGPLSGGLHGSLNGSLHGGLNGDPLRGGPLSAGPSAEWVAELERKLDDSAEDIGEELEGAGEEIPVIGNRPDRRMRRNVWLAAASVVVLLSAGTYVYVVKTEAGRSG